MSLQSILHAIIDKIPWPDEGMSRNLHGEVEKLGESDDSESVDQPNKVNPGVVQPDTLFGNGAR